MNVSYRHDPLSSISIKIIGNLEHHWLIKHADCSLVRIIHPNLGFWFNCCWTTCILFIKVIDAELFVIWGVDCLVDWLLMLNLLAWFLKPALSHVIRRRTILNIATKFRVRSRGFSLSKGFRCVKAATFDHDLFLLCRLQLLHVGRT